MLYGTITIRNNFMNNYIHIHFIRNKQNPFNTILKHLKTNASF